MRSSLRTVALAISAWLALAPAARAEVQLSIRNGRVTIVAKDATVRQILAEWARVGKTKIVNGERVPGGTVTLELKDVPEADALDVLLRTLSGYMAAPRTTSVGADASVYDAIVVMPTIAAAAGRVGTPSNAPPAFSPPVFNQTNEDEQQVGEGGPGVVRQGGANPVRPPIFTTFPSPQQGNPNGNGNAPRLVLPPEECSRGTKPSQAISCRGVAKRRKSPISATRMIAATMATPRNAWSAATTGCSDQLGTRAIICCCRRSRRAIACSTAWISSSKTIC